MIRTRRSSSTSLSDIPIHRQQGGGILGGEDRALVLAGRGSGFYKGDVSHADTLRVSSVTAPLSTKNIGCAYLWTCDEGVDGVDCGLDGGKLRV